MKKFEAGKTYYSRSICNHECIFTIEVVKRTEKTVTYIYDGRQRRSTIKVDENGEYIKPDNYSMAPVFRAYREDGTQDTEDQAAEAAREIIDEIGEDLAAGLVEYASLVKQLAEDVPGHKLTDTKEIKRLLGADLPGWDEEDWEDLRAAVEAESRRRKNLPKFKEVRTVSWDEIRNLCIAKEWYTRGNNEQYNALAGYVFDLEEITTENLVYIASDILDHSSTEYNLEAILWELNRVCNTSFIHE